MDREQTLQHLAEAEHHVAIGADHVARQRELIARLQRDGHDAAQAKQLLEQFEQLQQMHIADRDRLLAMVEKAGEGGEAKGSSASVQRCRERAAECERMASQAQDRAVE